MAPESKPASTGAVEGKAGSLRTADAATRSLGLEASAALRAARKSLHARMRAGEVSMGEAVGLPEARRDRVVVLLKCLPGVGAAWAGYIMDAYGLADAARVSRLGPKRSARLALEADGISAMLTDPERKRRLAARYRALERGLIPLERAFVDDLMRYERASRVLAAAPGVGRDAASRILSACGTDPARRLFTLDASEAGTLLDMAAVLVSRGRRSGPGGA